MAPRSARESQTAAYDLVLLVAAAIWGFAFVAQRVGMDFMGPFAFNGVRFIMGALVLLPLMAWRARTQPAPSGKFDGSKMLILGGGLAGFLVFLGASFQQVGLVTTTAGNAGFITGLYLVLVPMLGVLVGQRTNMGTAMGAVIAFIGLYLLSFTDSFSMSWGDLLVLIGAFCWAVQILVIGWLSPRMDTIRLAFMEFLACGLFSLAVAFAFEEVTLTGIEGAAVPLLYGGVMSVGIAYTLQVVVQKKANASHGALLMSLEAVFALAGGILFLGESLSLKGAVGCSMMLAGMLVSQLWGMRRNGGRGRRAKYYQKRRGLPGHGRKHIGRIRKQVQRNRRACQRDSRHAERCRPRR